MLAQHRPIALAEHQRVLVGGLGRGDDRQQARGLARHQPGEGASERSRAADAVVRGLVPAIEADAQLERVARVVREPPQLGQALAREERAVGEHRARPAGEGVGEDIEHPRVHERLAAGEVELLGAQRQALVDPARHLGAAHQRVVEVAGAARDEAVGAGEVAERACDLDPERVEAVEGLHREVPRARARRGCGGGGAGLGGTRGCRHGSFGWVPRAGGAAARRREAGRGQAALTPQARAANLTRSPATG